MLIPEISLTADDCGKTKVLKRKVESRIKFEVQSPGVVELCALLVDPSAVHAVLKVALIHPVLQKGEET